VGTTKIILNEASLKAFDIPLEQAVGSTIYFEPGEERYEFTVVGVVKDFHQFSLHRPIGPMLFMLSGSREEFPYLTASIDMKLYQRITDDMKEIWDASINDAPFESLFLNENLKTQYAAEARTSAMLTISTTIALVISCLGLYGLSVYVAQRKTKEIGIRKVVGASSKSIVGMLSKEYIKLIAISFVISVPAGYYGMEKWLEGFAYKISPGVTVFLLSGMISFFIAWLTISFESFRAAGRNPVDTLRAN
jgi:putative ABC transport system permease protein